MSAWVPYGVVDFQWGQLSLLGCSRHVQDSHTEALLLSLMGVGDLHQTIDKVVPPLHTDKRLAKSRAEAKRVHKFVLALELFVLVYKKRVISARQPVAFN